MTDSVEKQHGTVSVACIMSVPRLGFMDMMFCAQNVFPKLGIRVMKQTGAFWAESLERGLEQMIEQGYDWCFVADYDSVFTLPQAVAMLDIMHDNPWVDAVAPIQLKRDGEHVLFWTQHDCHISELRELPFFPVKSANFGLTLLRLSSLSKMPKPWMRCTVPGPDPDHPWGEGRRDPDVDFWFRWREHGNSLVVAPQVAIGHLEVFVLWPDKDLQPLFQHPNGFWETGIPREAWGSVGKREVTDNAVSSAGSAGESRPDDQAGEAVCRAGSTGDE